MRKVIGIGQTVLHIILKHGTPIAAVHHLAIRWQVDDAESVV